MNLYLVRHGTAVSKQEDPERPLSDAGVREVDAVGAFLAARWDFRGVRILHSGKARAEQTAARLARLIAPGTEIERAAGLTPNADIDAACALIDGAATDLMLAGHLPHLGMLAAHLLADDANRELVEFEKAAALCLTRDAGGDWLLRWMITPALAGFR